tara:strand:+ start:141 stop:386 length:246 start_codon:yes stop_codon:yes gene_type:complete
MNKRYVDNFGNVEKVDMRGNHFINGKCVNPKGYSDTAIGDTFDPTGLTESSLVEELNITGKVDEFSYFDHDLRKTVTVVVQ